MRYCIIIFVKVTILMYKRMLDKCIYDIGYVMSKFDPYLIPFIAELRYCLSAVSSLPPIT